ncbi:hypothetical protein CRUP_003050 [Coryphaenoides rupestris]|nr:hypothetical protein CRUP_003050 [Coryphaenoides rupestris]
MATHNPSYTSDLRWEDSVAIAVVTANAVVVVAVVVVVTVPMVFAGGGGGGGGAVLAGNTRKQTNMLLALAREDVRAAWRPTAAEDLRFDDFLDDIFQGDDAQHLVERVAFALVVHPLNDGQRRVDRATNEPTDHLHLAQRRGLEVELERAGRACRDLGRLASLANHMVAQALCSLGQREATSFLKGVVQVLVLGNSFLKLA